MYFLLTTEDVTENFLDGTLRILQLLKFSLDILTKVIKAGQMHGITKFVREGIDKCFLPICSKCPQTLQFLAQTDESGSKEKVCVECLPIMNHGSAN